MTNKFKKLKEEKDQLKTIMMASENLDPEEYK